MNKESKLTQAQARAICAQFNATLKSDGQGEYVVRNKTTGNKYFTDDLQDATNTARAMATDNV